MGAGLRSVPTVPLQGSQAPAAQGNSKNPIPRVPGLGSPLLPAPGSSAREGSDSPLGPLPCPAPGTAPSGTQQQAMQLGRLPQTCPTPQASLLGTETSPTRHTPPRVPCQQPSPAVEARMGKKPRSRHPTTAVVEEHPALTPTSSMAKPLQGPRAPHPCGEQGHLMQLSPQPQSLCRGHPSQCHQHVCPAPLQHPACRVPAPGLALAPMPAGSQPRGQTLASMPWCPSPTARPQHPCPGDSSPTAGPVQPYRGDPIPMAGPNIHSIALAPQSPRFAEPCSTAPVP